MWWTDLLLFFFPAQCLVCGKRVPSPHEVLCLNCEYNLPKTDFRDHIDNPVCRAFWGRVRVEMGTSLLRFEKGSAYQSLLHELKYGGNLCAGLYLGRMLGNWISHSPFSSCDIMVPVPLYRRRLKERGYNQSQIIAQGVSEVTGIPVAPDLLVRSIQHDSQTSMGRYERFQNVSGNFRVCRKASNVNGKRILLIDDVITTGATLEACCMALLNQFDCLIYIATAACA